MHAVRRWLESPSVSWYCEAWRSTHSFGLRGGGGGLHVLVYSALCMRLAYSLAQSEVDGEYIRDYEVHLLLFFHFTKPSRVSRALGR